MATNTYVALSTQTITGSPATSVTFTSIPQGYTDLVIVAQTKQSIGSSYCGIQFNGDTTSNYSQTVVYGTGSTATSVRGSNIPKIYPFFNTYETTGWLTTRYNIQNYANSTTYKTVLIRSDDSSAATYAGVGLWRKTPEAITSITISTQSDAGSGSFAVGSTFTLYGIAAASVGAKATGGTIYQDASYFYHVFAANGTFTPSQSLSCDYLVVGGGGGSSSYFAQSGGGSGGLRYATAQSLSATGYTVTVGAGGAGGVGTSSYGTGSTGSASSINSFSAAGGGGGSGSSFTAGSGGSGGGAWVTGTAGLGNTPSTSPVQGYDGAKGSTDSSTYTNGGAGGGAGGAASAAISTTRAANGGIGYYDSFTNAIGAATGFGVLSSSNYYFAGGGGGFAQAGAHGTGGTGGGGAGGGTNTGLANTGGGAGGNSGSVNGNAGGSGVVIVRYAK